MKYFTSDLHFNHKNICSGVSNWDNTNNCRDFKTIADMNDTIIASICDTVTESDILYILGDFAFGKKSEIPSLIKKLPTTDVRLIYGNHDTAIRRNQDFRKEFTWCRDYHETCIEDTSDKKHKLVLFHYYIGGAWNEAQRGSYHIFAHSHGNYPKNEIKGKAFDIGWDVWERPLSEHEVCDIMSELPSYNSVDHHESSI